MIKYHCAINDEGNLVNIDKVTQENRISMRFFCIGCGTEMEAVLGKQKEHHFRHKNKNDCNQETYLHRLAKLILRYRFDSQQQFLVKYYVRNECQKIEQCEFKKRLNWKDCSSVIQKTINLKEWYNICEEEVSHNGFRADLLLKHSEFPSRSPVFLEIAVTHDCTPEKIESRVRIIEIKVSNETDAFWDIIENDGGLVPESKVITQSYRNNAPLPPPIKFHNFKRTSKPNHQLNRFYLIRDNKGVCHGLCKFNTITCQHAESDHDKNTCFMVTIAADGFHKKQYGNLYALGIALAHRRCLGVKNCIFCVHYKRCTVSQDFWINQPQTTEPVLARKSITVSKLSIQDIEILQLGYRCPKYQLYEYAVHNVINSFKSIPYWEWSKEAPSHS